MVETPWQVPRQSRVLTAVKAAGVAASTLLLAALSVRVLAALGAAGTAAWLAPLGLLVGYLAADLLSGTAHWFCDTFFEEDTPWIGEVLIQPFREHHRHPQRITRYRFLEQDTANFFLMAPPLALTLWLGAPWPGSGAGLFWCSFLLGLAGGSFLTNLFHKWAHARQPPAAVGWLQRRGLILGPDRHHIHHRSYDRGFCVTSGWMNPLLDAVGFFPRLERAIRFFWR